MRVTLTTQEKEKTTRERPSPARSTDQQKLKQINRDGAQTTPTKRNNPLKARTDQHTELDSS